MKAFGVLGLSQTCNFLVCTYLTSSSCNLFQLQLAWCCRGNKNESIFQIYGQIKFNSQAKIKFNKFLKTTKINGIEREQKSLASCISQSSHLSDRISATSVCLYYIVVYVFFLAAYSEVSRVLKGDSLVYFRFNKLVAEVLSLSIDVYLPFARSCRSHHQAKCSSTNLSQKRICRAILA